MDIESAVPLIRSFLLLLFIYLFIQMKKEKTTHFIRFSLASMLLTAASVINAQSQDTSQWHKLKEVVVSASRSEQDPDNVGKSITVISNQDIQNSGANTLAEILSRSEGIYIVGTGQNPGQLQNVFMRGANGNQTAILIDGVRITDPSTADNAIDFSEISLANIDHIEIVRGSQSTLYGSSAIGGVINIITKKGMTPGVHADADLRGGTFGTNTSTQSEDLLINYTHKSGFYANGEIYNNSTNGLDATVDTVTDPKNYIHNHRERDNFSKTDLVGKLGFRNEKLDLFASYRREQQKADIDASAFSDDPAYTVDFTRNLFTYGAAYKANSKLSISYIGGMTDLKRVALDDSSVVDAVGTYNHNYFKGNYKGSTLTNELQGNYKIKGLSLVAGLATFNEKMTEDIYSLNTAFGRSVFTSSLDSLHISVNTISEFVHVNLDGSLFRDKWKIIAIGLGMRNTQHDLFGNNLTYEINPSLKTGNNGLLFASWTTGFNAPSLYQLYSSDRDPGSQISRGNNTLRPETSASMEFGFKQKLSEHVSFHFSYFKTVVENSIDYVYLWNKNKPVDSLSYSDYRGDSYVNIGKQTNQGFEFGVNTKVSDKLLINGNVSLVNGRLDYDPANINNQHTLGNQVQLFANGAFINQKVQSFSLVRRPSTANIGLTYKACKKLSVRADVRYTGPRNDVYYNSSLGPFGAESTAGMGDYTLVDVSARYAIYKGLSAGLRVENLFNEKYYEIYGYTTRGRSVYMNIRYSF
jgi:vitamin B12 transporter